MEIFKDKYGKLKIIKEVECNIKKYGYKQRHVLCVCDCGNEKTVNLNYLKRGSTKSCGCLNKEKSSKHGLRYSRIYKIWSCLKYRCNNKNEKNYGGRGITYDLKWEKFEGFYEDMKDGYSEDLSIDRIDNNGNYCKNNCRWANAREQARNTRTNRIYKGKCISERADIVGINYDIIHNRIRNNWKIKDAIFTPKKINQYK